ncbi:hypothetical protein [Streptomyces sp. NPDC046759]|uniref:hypothetical protein n=1 Tax=Streptomyces sp. NPDC046759 TaxID=3155019 RepID=UPI00340EF680
MPASLTVDVRCHSSKAGPAHPPALDPLRGGGYPASEVVHAGTGSWDGTVRVWDLTAGRPVGAPLISHTDEVRAVATGVADGRPIAASGSRNGTVRVWDLTTGRPTGHPLVFPAPVHAVKLTPDGRLLVGFGWEVAVLTPVTQPPQRDDDLNAMHRRIHRRTAGARA